MNVANLDVVSMADWCVKFARELVVSQSARTAEFAEFDRNRATDYLGRIQNYADLAAEVKLDLPATHPGSYPVAEFIPNEDINAIENAVVKNVLRRIQALYNELTKSQSKDSATGLHPADKSRLDSLLAETKKVIDFGETTLDLPENTGPSVASSS